MTALFQQGMQIKFHPLGHYELALDNVTPQLLPSLPDASRLRRVVIRVRFGDISWTDDGTDPSSSHGMPLLSDETLVYDGDPTGLRFVADANTSQTAELRIAYHGL